MSNKKTFYAISHLGNANLSHSEISYVLMNAASKIEIIINAGMEELDHSYKWYENKSSFL